ncbi:SHOCT domain-containing protein [Streptomyces sp. NPDC053048]|uniref:SHOCT domain-containing protein n=1 Tax=Streptomyces sp. NPDC053048 TaxID=3365694 RepID=UPI0037D66F58
MVRPQHEWLGLVRDGGQHDPLLGTDHHRRRPALPGLGPPDSARRRGHTGWHKEPPPSSPEQILAERYARGEIDEEEYQRRLATLRGSPPGPPEP